MQFDFSYLLMANIAGPIWSQGPALIDPSDLAAVVVIPSVCLMIGWLVWMLTRTNHLRTQASIELHRRLLEKLNSAQDIVSLMQSQEGRQFLDALAMEQTKPHDQILGSVQKGVILTSVGLGGISLRLFFPTGFGVFIVIGVFVGAIGLGFLISSFVAYRLSKSWDLLGPRRVWGDRPDPSLFR